MKNLILFLLLIIPFSLVAQDNISSATMNDQTDLWMNKISSDSILRIKMMNMMAEKTKGNTEEMEKLANSISSNTELYSILMEAFPQKAGNETISVEPRGITNERINADEKYITNPVIVPKK